MRTYFADIEGMKDRSSFLYHIEKETDAEAITHFRQIFGDRVEMICIKGTEKFISVYEKPGLFLHAEDIIPINYRSVLKKYIKHIIDNEGVSFINYKYHDTQGPLLSDREWEELQTLESEVS